MGSDSCSACHNTVQYFLKEYLAYNVMLRVEVMFVMAMEVIALLVMVIVMILIMIRIMWWWWWW